MKKHCKKLAVYLISGSLLVSTFTVIPGTPFSIEAEAHSGRTDANGGHKDNQNKSGLGSYHYHCGGYPAHLHPNGVCPYQSGAASEDRQTTQQTEQKPAVQPETKAETQPETQATAIGWHQDASGWYYCKGENQYYKDGLRMIEIYKHQFKYLSEIIAEIKNRNYRFIIYMDDLSFEEFEIEYKFLKAVIEGGVETKPENILIYATSNRRHLIKESWNDRNDQDNSNDRHHSDTVEEKLSLVNRFGVTINYSKPTQKEYFDIVLHLARRAGVTLPDEELRAEANKWELSHGGISGRTAEQFVSYLASQPDAFK